MYKEIINIFDTRYDVILLVQIVVHCACDDLHLYDKANVEVVVDVIVIVEHSKTLG